MSRVAHAILVCVISVAFALGSDVDHLWQQAQSIYGEDGKVAVQHWQNLFEQAQTENTRQQLTTVNDFFNSSIVFGNDVQIWGESDYWATPLETLVHRHGDCEDFSIAKYISLRRLGFNDKQLRLVYVKADVGSAKPQAHMVLAYYSIPTAEPLILDNLNQEIWPASKRTDLTPVFSFNSEGLWVGSDPDSRVRKPETRLSRWREVLLRMRAEGVDWF